MVPALCDDGAHGDTARSRLAPERVVVPELLSLEVLSAVRRLASAGNITPRRTEEAVDLLRVFPAVRIRHGQLLDRAWALRQTVTPYDAVYVAIAEALSLTLVTADRRLARAPGLRCDVEVLD